jgi:hypothetical protein
MSGRVAVVLTASAIAAGYLAYSVLTPEADPYDGVSRPGSEDLAVDALSINGQPVAAAAYRDRSRAGAVVLQPGEPLKIELSLRLPEGAEPCRENAVQKLFVDFSRRLLPGEASYIDHPLFLNSVVKVPRTGEPVAHTVETRGPASGGVYLFALSQQSVADPWRKSVVMQAYVTVAEDAKP